MKKNIFTAILMSSLVALPLACEARTLASGTSGVINTPSAYQANALKWAIFNTTCIELLDSKEHAATIANLCRRFRLASTKQEYHWLLRSILRPNVESCPLVRQYLS